MARLLDAVTPLADLVCRASDPTAVAAAVRAACPQGPKAVVAAVRECGVDERLATLALTHAGIEVADQTELAALVGALQVLVEQRGGEDVSLVFTVPAFLAEPFEQFTAATPSVRAERTGIVIGAVAASATRTLTIAAPYLATVTTDNFIPHVLRVLDGGGIVTVITRALSPRAPEPSPANVAAVTAIRDAAQGHAGRLRVCSWEEDGLGVHLKAVVADGTEAYLGSANLTGAGQLGHAEAGTRLPARLAGPLQSWLDLLADALEKRRGVASYR